MEEHDKRRVGEQIEPGGRRKAPGRLELLQRFVNSYNHDFPRDWDRIGTPEKAQAWLREKGLVAPGDRISDADVARLGELREAIRALAIANQGGDRRRRRRTPFAGPPARLSSASPSTTRDGPPSQPRVAASTGRGDAPRHPPRGAAHRSLVAHEGLPQVRLRVLRPLEEPVGGVVLHVDLRQPDEEPRVLPAPSYVCGMSARHRSPPRASASPPSCRSSSPRAAP